MSILRQGNFLGNQRIDVPHLRGLESSIANDFDLLAGKIMGNQQALVVAGFQVVSPQTAVGNAATALQINVGGGLLVHAQASESGTIFSVDPSRTVEVLSTGNVRLQGSWQANAVNYVGVDLRRSADATTSDLVMFLDSVSLLENAKTVPLARTLDYVLNVSTVDFTQTPNIAPVAIVTTDTNNNILSLKDARSLMFRLATGSSSPNISRSYEWPAGRSENTSTSTDVFSGGDKVLGSLKSWMDAIMSRLWELGGGSYWYSPTADRNTCMVRVGSTMANGEYFTWSGTDLTWQGIRFVFDNSPGYYNDVANQTTTAAGLTNLAEGECIYVDLDRTQNRTGSTALVVAKAALTNLGTPAVPGARQVIAYRASGTNQVYARGTAWPVGTLFTPATTTATGVVALSATPANSVTPVVASCDTNTNAQANGITRGGLGSGMLWIGGGANDASVNVGGGTAAAIYLSPSSTSGVVNAYSLSVAKNGTGSTLPGLVVAGNGNNATLDDTPSAIYKTSGGEIRHLVDHMGFPGGARRSEFREEWLALSPVTSPAGATYGLLGGRWNVYLNGTGGIVQGIPLGNTVVDTVTMVAPTAAPAMGVFAPGNTVDYVQANMWSSNTFPTAGANVTPYYPTTLVAEWELQAHTAAAFPQTFVGFSSAFGTASSVSGTVAPLLSTAGTYSIGFSVPGGGAVDVSVNINGSVNNYAGPAGSASSASRVRLEIHTPNSHPYGSTTQLLIRAWINNVLVLNSYFAGSENCPFLSFGMSAAGSNSGQAVVGIIISPVYITWNRITQPDAL